MTIHQNSGDHSEMECNRCRSVENIKSIEESPRKGPICEQCADKASLTRLLIPGPFVRDPATIYTVSRGPVTKTLPNGTQQRTRKRFCGCEEQKLRYNPRQRWKEYRPTRRCEIHRPTQERR